MSKTVERYQNPAVKDTVNLRAFTYNSSNFSDVDVIEKIEIFYFDSTLVTDDNPQGLRLVESFDESDVTKTDTGSYLLPIELKETVYVIGNYCDVWTVSVSDDQPSQTIRHIFTIYPNLWYSTPMPVVYDFQFHFQPNKMRKGSIQYLIVEIIPNVPTAGDLRQYYENLAIVSDLKLSMEKECGNCLPEEEDLRSVLDKVSVDYREKRYGFYHLDTEDLELDCGIYMLTFQLEFGGNRYISDKMAFQIYN